MKRIRYLMIMMVALLMGSAATYAQDDFNPESPSEPGDNGQLYQSRVVLLRNIDDAGSVSGAGRYYVGKSVTVYAYTNTGYTFNNWTDTKGNVLATTSSYTFVNSDKADTLIANYEFVPGSPSEPADPSTTLRYRLLLVPTEGLTVSGSGRYLAGKSVYCSAYMEEGYTFLGWYKKDGTQVSADRYFYYTMPVGGDTLTAKCEFDPNSVAEPGDPILKHNLTVTCGDGGYWSGTSGRVLEGTSFSLRAYNNDGYDFKGWYLNGEFYTALSSFSYTMGKEDLNFYAEFEFNPSSPKEPAMPAISQYSYYLPTVNGKPGETVKYSINLVNTEVVKDMDIRLTFPAGVVLSPTDYTLSNLATGYTVTVAPAIDTISIIEEGAQLWDFSFVGGTTEPATQALLTFNVFLPDILPTGYSHQVKINQISMTMADGTAVTAHTRNGRLGVFKLGDANGDNDVNVVDISNTVSVLKGGSSDDLIPEVMDTNEDGVTDDDDVTGMATIADDESDTGSIYEGTALNGTFASTDNLNHTMQVMVNSSEKYVAFQMDIKLPKGVTYQSITPSEARMPESSSFITNSKIINEEENIVRVLAYNMSNTALSGDASDPLFTLNLLSEEEKSADTLSASFSKVIFVREADLAGVLPAEPGADYVLGDANNSGEVNVADITAVVSHIYGQTPTNFNTDAADVNKSGEINVADITGIVSIIYGGSSTEAKSIVTSAAPVTLSLPTVSVNAAGSVCVPFSLTNSGNLSSCQFDLVLPDGIKAEYIETMSYAHQYVGRYISDNTYRIMCYSMSNANFMASAPVGYLTLSVDGIADGTYNLGITSAVVSSKGEDIIPAVQNGKLTVGNPTGINEISASDSEQTLTVISLNGMRFKLDKSRLNSLQKGIYIINGKKQAIK